ncbi:hypothetical protein ACHAWF_003040 [Thalassiosira exigua]
MVAACSNCNKYQEDGETPLMQCSVCRGAKYCNADCQRSHWPSHKSTCSKRGCLQLIAAIQANDGVVVARLAKMKRVLNGKVGYTPPATASNPSPYEMGDWTALHECVRLENIEMMKLLVANGANLEIKDVDGETPAFVASTSRCPEMMKVLLDAGANPNAMAQDGWTCLMMSARGGDYGTTKALLDAGAHLMGVDDFGRTALDISSQQATGQMGIRMTDGETMAEAQARHRRVTALLTEYSGRYGR